MKMFRVAWIVVFLAAVWAAGAQAAPAKKKTARRKTAAVRKADAPAPVRSGIIGGSNVYGRTGLLFTETAQTIQPGHASATGNILFSKNDQWKSLTIPVVGANYGVAPHMEIAGSAEVLSEKVTGAASASGLGYLSVSGKYVFEAKKADMPDFAALAEISHGPLTKKLGDDGTNVTVKGLITRPLPNKLLLNGGAGLLFVGSRTHSSSDTVLQVEGGAGYPLTPKLTGIAELAVNRFGKDDGLFSLGLRGTTSSPAWRWQALVGFGVGSNAPDYTIGGGVRYSFGR
jgi:hypothetical protein